MKVLVLDNYDSFTYNLVQIIRELNIVESFDVIRNDQIELDKIGDYDKILLSPGPGIPSEAGIMPQLIKHYAASKSILGVCLGHQAIAEAFGGEIYNLDQVFHGVTTSISLLNQSIIFKDIPENFNACRYHSWIVKTPLPDELILTAVDDSGMVMALQHKYFSVFGVQFHPESIMTEHGAKMIENWLSYSL